MRSDFQHRLADFPYSPRWRAARTSRDRTRASRPWSSAFRRPGDLRDMIFNPARAAGLIFETRGERDLAQLIEAEARPEAMPSVQFLLDGALRRARRQDADARSLRCARRRQTASWRHAAKRLSERSRPGGARRVSARRARAGDAGPQRRPREHATRAGARVRRRCAGGAPDRRAPARPGSSSRIAASCDSPMTACSPAGRASRTRSPRSSGLFAARERQEQYCARWIERRRGGTSYWLEGFRARRRPRAAGEVGRGRPKRQAARIAGLYRGIGRARRRSRLDHAGDRLVGCGGVRRGVGDDAGPVAANLVGTEGNAGLAVDRAVPGHLRDGNIAAAVDRADRAFTSVPTEPHRSTLLSTLMELSPHLVAITRLGKASEALAWTNGTTLVVAAGSLRGFAPLAGNPDDRPDDRWVLPSATPKEEPSRVALALRPIGADRVLAVFDDGAIVLAARDGKAARRYGNEMSLGRTAHAVAISADATTIVTATVDDTITLHPLRLDAPETCRPQPLGQLRGRAVAISPDGQRIAVGDPAGNVTLSDLRAISSGRRSGSVRPSSRSAGRDSATGSPPARRRRARRARRRQRRRPSDRSRRIASATGRSRPWHGAQGTSTSRSCAMARRCACGARMTRTRAFKPAIRFEGHANAVTRLAWAPNGRHLASSDTDGTIRVWGLVANTDATYALYSDGPAEFSTVAASPDGKWVAAGAKDGTIRLWASTGARAGRLIRPAVRIRRAGADLEPQWDARRAA